MQSKELPPPEMTIPDLAPQDKSSDSKNAGRPLPSPEVFQALVCIEGRFTAQASDLRSGLLTTPDGIQFSFSFGRTNLWEKLIQKYGEIELEQPFPAQGIVWVAYPYLRKDSLALTGIGIRSDRHSLEPEQLKVQGVVIAKSEDEFCLRVYRNLGKVPPSQLTNYSDLKVKGQLPQKARLGWTYRVIAHREGGEFIADTVEAIYIHSEWQVRKAIAQVLKPSPPPAPPIRASQKKEVKSDAALGESPTRPLSLEIKPEATVPILSEVSLKPKQVALLMVPPAEPVEPQPVSAETKQESATNAKPFEASAVPAAKPSKKKQAAFPVSVSVEPEPIAAPQPEPSTIPHGTQANAVNPEPKSPVAVPNAPAVSGAKFKQKKQDSVPTSAATVPAEKKPEAAQRPKPKFLVQVDRQTFGGQASVVLKAGMLLIDGKPVVRTKLAIVIGEPQTISADGKKQTSGNQTILSSR
ncbi:MAG TPA: hypothetical protein V6D18_14025 [Thermosynechococcaceae cyanobacterium]